MYLYLFKSLSYPGLRFATVLTLSLLLSGCLLLNNVRPGRLSSAGAPASKAQIVYGLDAANGPVALSFARYDPLTGDVGNCSHYDRTEASTTTDASGVTYFVFDAPPGTYVKAAFGTSNLQHSELIEAFDAPGGHQVFVGTFVRLASNDPKFSPNRSDEARESEMAVGHSFARDLEAAKAALGPAASQLELATLHQVAARPKWFVCTP